jgi:drug/metabolite transporter (DMT)-like permease
VLHADSARNRLVGIGIVSLTYLIFSVLDGSAKWLVQSMPVVMVVWLRFLIHVIFAGAVLLPVKGLSLLKTNHLRWHLARSVMFVAMTAMNFWALQYLQLTVTSSIFFSTPIIIALLSAQLLGEKLDPRRLVAILTGFAGVLVIVHPWSADFHPAMLLAVMNAVIYAVFMMMTRHLAAYDPPETIQFLPAIGATIILTPFAIAAWEAPDTWLEWTLACFLGVFGGVGHYLLALAHRYAPSSVIAPFVYQQVIYMALFGYLVFGDVPGAAVWIGAAIVIASGLYLFSREGKRA